VPRGFYAELLTRIAQQHNYHFSISKIAAWLGWPRREGRERMAGKRRKSSTLGERVRLLRSQRGMTLTRLSALCGISVSTLSKLENGQTGLNLDNVIRLAGGFSMPVSILLNEGSAASGAWSISRSGGAYNHKLTELDFEVLHNDLPAQRNIFWKVRVKCRTLAKFGPYHSHPGEEFFYVLEGKVQFLIRDQQPKQLGPGDSIQFDSALDHAYLSVGRNDALILMSNTITHAKLPGYIDWSSLEKPEPSAPLRTQAAAKTGHATRQRRAPKQATRRHKGK
jgi:transcriptional regulator with XRE-family HTH domain